MSYTKKTNLVIYETKNYDQFHSINKNRDVTRNKELYRVIEQNNKLPFNPIIVSPTYEVLDGQHRLHVAKMQDKPVFFIIDPEGKAEDIPDMNVATKNWTLSDHLQYHAKDGNPHYQFIHKMLKEHRISLTSLLDGFCRNRARDQVNNGFRRGLTELKYPQEFIEKILGYYDEIYEVFITVSKVRRFSRSFQSVLIRLLKHDNYSHKRMMDSLRHRLESFVNANSLANSDLIQNVLLEKVYNAGLKENSKHWIDL